MAARMGRAYPVQRVLRPTSLIQPITFDAVAQYATPGTAQ
jgi:hypothetical protein